MKAKIKKRKLAKMGIVSLSEDGDEMVTILMILIIILITTAMTRTISLECKHFHNPD